MYNAAGGSTNDFLEFHNRGNSTLNLGGLQFTQGIDYVFPAGTTLFSAGDASNTGYMLLLLEGDVSVDTGNSGGASKVDISSIGPGALMGELALMDGAPRSATCTAISPVVAAGLSSGGLQRLIEQFPQVAIKLVIYIAQSASERLRSLSEQLQMYDQITNDLRQENAQLRLAAKR